MDGSEGRRRGPAPAVMSGPLALSESLLRAELARLGYAAPSVREAVRMLARLSGWMAQRDMAAADLTSAAVEAFVAARREVCRSEPGARRSLTAVLRVLRGTGVAPDRAVPTVTAVEALLADYRAYLVGERGLAAESVRCYGAQARTVLTQVPAPLNVALAVSPCQRCHSSVHRQAGYPARSGPAIGRDTATWPRHRSPRAARGPRPRSSPSLRRRAVAAPTRRDSRHWTARRVGPDPLRHGAAPLAPAATPLFQAS